MFNSKLNRFFIWQYKTLICSLDTEQSSRCFILHFEGNCVKLKNISFCFFKENSHSGKFQKFQPLFKRIFPILPNSFHIISLFGKEHPMFFFFFCIRSHQNTPYFLKGYGTLYHFVSVWHKNYLNRRFKPMKSRLFLLDLIYFFQNNSTQSLYFTDVLFRTQNIMSSQYPKSKHSMNFT